jgi:hypothetical protein
LKDKDIENWSKHLVFISGPITGMPDLNIPAFNEAEERIKKTGAAVYNPASLPLGKNWEWYMDQCFDALSVCTAFYQLPGWENSRGARIENEWALEFGLRFVTDAEVEKLLNKGRV